MKFKIIISTVLLVFLSGCLMTPVQDNYETETGELSGTWGGSWTSSSTNKKGLLRVNLSHIEPILRGVVSLENSPCMDIVNISGRVSDNKVDMFVRSDNNTFSINMHRNKDLSIGGTYDITTGKCKGSSGEILLTQINNIYYTGKAKEEVSSFLSDTWDNLNTQAGQNSWDTKLYRLGEALSNMGTPYSQRGVSPSYRWMADDPNSGFDYSDYNRMSEQNKTDRKIKELEKKIEDTTFGYMRGSQMYSKSNKYMGYIKGGNLYNEYNQKTGYIRGNGIYSNSGKYLGYTR